MREHTVPARSKGWSIVGLVIPVLLALIVQNSAAATTRAAATPSTVTFNRSCEHTAKTQNALNRCAAAELGEVQYQLKAALSALLHSKLVRAAQSRFVAYEKSECTAAAAPNRGGSIYPLIYDGCEVRLTVQRIQEVRQDASG